METAVVESVPNFSEGRSFEVLEALAAAARKIEGVKLLDYSADRDHNRSVYTLLGKPDAVSSAILEMVAVAVSKIDMEKHKGEHPRIGAVDVIPLIPILNTTMQDCVELAHSLGEEIARRFRIPVYFYEEAAKRPERRNLADLRRGEYEGLKREILMPERHPDAGEPVMHPTAGATIVGARKPLLAYNVNLSTGEVKVAKEIARRVRAKTGGLAYVKALGVMLKEKNQAQVTMNLTDYTRTAIYTVFEMVKLEARRYGVSVVSSEIIGMVPMEALVEAARFYLQIEDFPSSRILESHLLDLQGG